MCVCLSVCLSICLYVCLFVWPSLYQIAPASIPLSTFSHSLSFHLCIILTLLGKSCSCCCCCWFSCQLCRCVCRHYSLSSWRMAREEDSRFLRMFYEFLIILLSIYLDSFMYVLLQPSVLLQCGERPSSLIFSCTALQMQLRVFCHINHVLKCLILLSTYIPMWELFLCRTVLYRTEVQCTSFLFFGSLIICSRQSWIRFLRDVMRQGWRALYDITEPYFLPIHFIIITYFTQLF